MQKPGRSFLTGFVLGTVFGTVLLVGVVLGVALCFQKPLTRLMAAQQAPRLKAPALSQRDASDLNWQVRDMGGVVLDMTEFSGRPLFLHFWHTACVSCVAEIQSLNRLHEQLKDSGVEMVCIALGTQDEVAAELPALGVGFPVYVQEGERPEAFRASATPATYILDAKGAIVFSHMGGAKWDDPATIAFLKTLPALTAPGAQ